MSYKVIARKWRPKSFKELVGQSHISQTLLNAMEGNRLPHALLFTGPRGTGKTSSARILAKTLRCPNVKDFIPCNKCDECELINAGKSVDVTEIDGASNNGVDDVRSLRDSVGMMPFTGKAKVYIIDEVHMLSGSAFNALLKTLEEPPDHVVFVLATTEAHKLPNTILSRCQRFDFRRIPTRQIADHLAAICESEGINADADSLWAVARQGDGSMRDAQSLLDQVITFSGGSITLQTVVNALGLTDRALLVESIEALVERSSEKGLDVVSKIFKSGIEATVFVQDLLEEIRHLLMVKISGQHCLYLVDLPDSEIKTLQNLASHLSEEDIHLLFDMTLKGANDLPRSQEPRLVLEMLMMRMVNAPRIVDILKMQFATPVATQAIGVPSSSAVGVASSTGTTTQTSASASGSASSTSESVPASEAPMLSTLSRLQNGSGNALEEKWSELVKKIKGVNSIVAAKLEHSYLKSLNDKDLTVAIPARMKFLHDQVTEADFQKKLSNYISTFWGAKYNLNIELDKSMEKKTEHLTPKALEEEKTVDQKNKVREQVENHPLIKTAYEVFKSNVQDIKETP